MRKQTRPASARPSPFAPPKRRCSGGVSSTAEARKAQGKHRTPLDGIMLRRHCRGPDRGFPGAPGRNCEQRLLSPSGCPGTASASASTLPSEAPQRRFFRRPAKPNDTSLPLLHQRSFNSRSGFYLSSTADSPKAVLPDLRKGGVQCQRIKSCKNDSRARSKKVPRSGRF